MLKVKYVEQDGEYAFAKEVINKLDNGVVGIIAVGPTGCGKTLMGRNLADDYNAIHYTIDGSSQTDRRDLEGSWEIIDKNTVFMDGPLVKSIDSANKDGIAFLIINEINAIRPSEQISLNGILSENEINLISKSGEKHKLEPNAKLVIIGTMNMGVLGINPLQEAFFDRFEIIQAIDYPNESTERKILKSVTNCNNDLAQVVSNMAFKFREAQRTGYKLSKDFSTRLCVSFINVITKVDKKYLDKCFETMILNKLSIDGTEKEYINNLLIGHHYKRRVQEALG